MNHIARSKSVINILSHVYFFYREVIRNKQEAEFASKASMCEFAFLYFHPLSSFSQPGRSLSIVNLFILCFDDWGDL